MHLILEQGLYFTDIIILDPIAEIDGQLVIRPLVLHEQQCT